MSQLLLQGLCYALQQPKGASQPLLQALTLALRSMTFSQVKSETGSRPKWPYAAVFLYLGRLRSRLRAISPAAQASSHAQNRSCYCVNVSPHLPAACSNSATPGALHRRVQRLRERGTRSASAVQTLQMLLLSVLRES